jgi:cytochrome c oxidase cbb3-type subunit 3
MPFFVRTMTLIAVQICLLPAFLVIAGCNSHQPVASSVPPSPTNVGPVPGPPAPLTAAVNPLAGDPVAMQDGRRLFNWYNCSGCHGGHAGGGMGPSLRDKTWLYGDRDDQIFDSIAEGRSNGMPAWGSKIPSNQIWELVAYIKSMRTPGEPEPPVEPANEETPNSSDNTPYGVGSHQH